MLFCAVIEIKAILQIPEFPFAMSQYDTVKHEDLAVKMEELDLDQTNLTSCWNASSHFGASKYILHSFF